MGLEHPDDLIADLEQALEGVESRARFEAGPADRQSPDRDALAARVETLLEERIRPTVRARGGDLRLRGIEHRTVMLEFDGSPGAFLPMKPRVEELLTAEAPEVDGVEFVARPDGAVSVPSRKGESGPSDPSAVQALLDELINPAVAAHGGRIRLTGLERGAVKIRLEGRCQGCGLAEVTVRQGIERILRERVAGITAVVDETDHDAGTNPYYRPRKK